MSHAAMLRQDGTQLKWASANKARSFQQKHEAQELAASIDVMVKDSNTIDREVGFQDAMRKIKRKRRKENEKVLGEEGKGCGAG